MTTDRTTDDYTADDHLPEGSRWIVTYPEPDPKTDLVAWSLYVSVVGVRTSNLAWILLTPSECRKVLGAFSQLEGAQLRDGKVYVPLD